MKPNPNRLKHKSCWYENTSFYVFVILDNTYVLHVVLVFVHNIIFVLLKYKKPRFTYYFKKNLLVISYPK